MCQNTSLPSAAVLILPLNLRTRDQTITKSVGTELCYPFSCVVSLEVVLQTAGPAEVGMLGQALHHLASSLLWSHLLAYPKAQFSLLRSHTNLNFPNPVSSTVTNSK